jgi:hypothetical protein
MMQWYADHLDKLRADNLNSWIPLLPNNWII